LRVLTSTDSGADSAAAPTTLTLNEDEVRRLLEDKSPATLIDLTSKIAGVYNQQKLGTNENMAAEQIFRLLLRDTELRVRVALAEQVKSNPAIPRDIVLSLAQDVEEVALPILQHSEVLDDNDLIELVNSTEDINRYLAISKRDQISGTVSHALLAINNETVAATLVDNGGAEISENNLQQIVTRYPGNQNLIQAIGTRPHLPIAVAEKMINVVSASLAESLREKYQLPTKEIELEVEKTRESETLKLIRQARSPEEIDRLVNHLHSFSRLTPSIILSALCQGSFEFFEVSLARLSNIPVANARTLINDRGELGFRAIYNKSGLTESMFPAVRLLLKTMHDLDIEGEKPGTSRYVNRIIELILQYSTMVPVENLSYIIALVRRSAQ